MDVFQGGNDNNILSGFAFRKMLEIKPKSAKLEVKSKREMKDIMILYYITTLLWVENHWYKSHCGINSRVEASGISILFQKIKSKSTLNLWRNFRC